MELEIIESHLVLLSRIPRRFVSSGTVIPTWWGNLLNTWFFPDDSGAYKLPSIVSLTSSSTVESMHTSHGFVSLSSTNKLSISSALRSAFLISGLPQLSSVGKTRGTQISNTQVVNRLIPFLLCSSLRVNSGRAASDYCRHPSSSS